MIRTLTIAMLAAVSLASVATPVFAKQQDRTWPADKLGKETSIPFIGTIGLYNFEADSDRGVWLQDQQRRWYYATVVGPCTGLPFANRIGVDTRFGGTQLDRTGTLLVDRQRCPINSLVASNGPPPKAKKAKKKG
ncbi:DUF6491 family protein [Sphingomonas asaccharolytica]|uniref:DUF6491 family protein n=1 Tax=Sphingomonas asaccharolytica TaxID=40681 RepID=UPI000831A050|nr:DUF6491 family protein [Sphingomonas asaccharolytica]